METLLKNLASRMAVYGATYKMGYYGTLVLGEVEIEVEINIRRVARIEGKRFLYGTRRGYDLNEMVRHILLQLPRLQERAKEAREYKQKRKTVEENKVLCADLTKLVDDSRIRLTFNEYEAEGKKFIVTCSLDSYQTAAVAIDMFREIEDFSRPTRYTEKPTTAQPMRFSWCDENGDPDGSEISLKGLANGGIDLDRAVTLVVGEVMSHEDLRLIRIA